MKDLKAKLCISRPRGGGIDYVQIEIVDAASHCIAASVKVGLTDFAEALFGLYGVVGMVREHKTEIVTLPRHYAWEQREVAARAAVGPFEVDGWKGQWADLLNHHNRQPGAEPKYRVRFERYVPPAPDSREEG